MGSLHPSVARIYNNIGCVHVEFNEYREARRAFEAALDVQRSALSQDPESGPLLFATATTLCNLGYLYRFRDMHSKATVVLKEAAALQERVLGRHHSTVLSTIDNLADSCANSGQSSEALRQYGTVLERFRTMTRSSGQHYPAGHKSSDSKSTENALRAEAVLLYKMSRVHRQRNDRESQLAKLKLALRAVRAHQHRPAAATLGGDGEGGGQYHHPSAAAYDPLERRIQYDIRTCREQLEKEELEWV
jgi:tetratricopeptide (TPR) repeat protein